MFICSLFLRWRFDPFILCSHQSNRSSPGWKEIIFSFSAHGLWSVCHPSQSKSNPKRSLVPCCRCEGLIARCILKTEQPSQALTHTHTCKNTQTHMQIHTHRGGCTKGNRKLIGWCILKTEQPSQALTLTHMHTHVNTHTYSMCRGEGLIARCILKTEEPSQAVPADSSTQLLSVQRLSAAHTHTVCMFVCVTHTHANKYTHKHLHTHAHTQTLRVSW